MRLRWNHLTIRLLISSGFAQPVSTLYREAASRAGDGVPATEVARRAGHGVAVLLKIFANCIDGQADAANQRITDALGTTEPESDPGDEEDDDSEQIS